MHEPKKSVVAFPRTILFSTVLSFFSVDFGAPSAKEESGASSRGVEERLTLSFAPFFGGLARVSWPSFAPAALLRLFLCGEARFAATPPLVSPEKWQMVKKQKTIPRQPDLEGRHVQNEGSSPRGVARASNVEKGKRSRRR